MANTTADKLALLEATKADLKAALAEKGQTVGDVFSTYPAAVRAIETQPIYEKVSVSLYFPITMGLITVFYTEDGVSERIDSFQLNNQGKATLSIDKNSVLGLFVPFTQNGAFTVSPEQDITPVSMNKFEGVGYNTFGVFIIDSDCTIKDSYY